MVGKAAFLLVIYAQNRIFFALDCARQFSAVVDRPLLSLAKLGSGMADYGLGLTWVSPAEQHQKRLRRSAKSRSQYP